MRTEVYHINSENENRYGMMSSMYSRGSDNSAERRRMCKVLTKAMYGLLTKKQLAEYPDIANITIKIEEA